MPTSTCTSKRHQEFDCMIRWSVSPKKWAPKNWCDACRTKYADTNLVKGESK